MNKSNKNQGIAHLLSIFLLPALVVAGFYIKWLFARIILLGIFVYVSYQLWNKVLKN
ncbi:MAG: hypothetical protein KDD41_05540 [Flavobacteriales bacterium]|nr:hypothetical protein [Flavobacteriales bacterium]